MQGFCKAVTFHEPCGPGGGGWRVACSVGFGVKIHLHVPVWLKGALSGYGERN